MTSVSPANAQPAALFSEQTVVETRFGRMEFSPESLIAFPSGMLGMPDVKLFALSSFPSPKMARFTLLQSLDDHALSFITLPLTLENPLVAAEDLLLAARDLEIPADKLATLLIVSVAREQGVAHITVNARAPLFLQTDKRLGVQHVFPHNKYEIRTPISL